MSYATINIQKETANIAESLKSFCNVLNDEFEFQDFFIANANVEKGHVIVSAKSGVEVQVNRKSKSGVTIPFILEIEGLNRQIKYWESEPLIKTIEGLLI